MGADFKFELAQDTRGILENVVAILCDREVALVIGDDVEETIRLLFQAAAERVLEELLRDFGPTGLAHALNAAAAYMRYEATPWERLPPARKPEPEPEPEPVPVKAEPAPSRGRKRGRPRKSRR